MTAANGVKSNREGQTKAEMPLFLRMDESAEGKVSSRKIKSTAKD
jgi:hypothetical protein